MTTRGTNIPGYGEAGDLVWCGWCEEHVAPVERAGGFDPESFHPDLVRDFAEYREGQCPQCGRWL